MESPRGPALADSPTGQLRDVPVEFRQSNEVPPGDPGTVTRTRHGSGPAVTGTEAPPRCRRRAPARPRWPASGTAPVACRCQRVPGSDKNSLRVADPAYQLAVRVARLRSSGFRRGPDPDMTYSAWRVTTGELAGPGSTRIGYGRHSGADVLSRISTRTQWCPVTPPPCVEAVWPGAFMGGRANETGPRGRGRASAADRARISPSGCARRNDGSRRFSCRPRFW